MDLYNKVETIKTATPEEIEALKVLMDGSVEETLAVATNLARAIYCLWLMSFFSIQSVCVYIHKYLTKRPTDLTIKLVIDLILFGYALGTAILFKIWGSKFDGPIDP